MNRHSLSRTLASVMALGALLYPSHRQERPLVEVPYLAVNTSIEVFFETSLDEREGIRQLKEIVETAETEECWAYLPLKNRWVEIGEMETESSVKNNIELLESLIDKHSSLVLYHIHLSSEESAGDLGVPSPSSSDERSMALISRAFFLKHPEGNIRFGVTSEYGVTYYGLTQTWKKRFIDMESPLSLSFALECVNLISSLKDGSSCWGRSGMGLGKPTSEELSCYFERRSNRAVNYHFVPYSDVFSDSSLL